MHKNENRPGYKNSKVGWIPEEWSETTLGLLLEKHPCYGINAAAVEYSERLPTYLRITDISEDGYFLKETKVSVNSENSNDYMLDNGDLVFARTGASTGKTYLYDPNDGPLVFAGFLIRVRPNPNKLHPQFLKAFTSTYLYWNWISVTSMRSGQPGVNGNEYATMELALPPLPEQKAIAGVLECWDKGIRKLELKIQKKRLIKNGLMQRLLSGKQRLKGFTKEWKRVELGNVFDFVATYAFSRECLTTEANDNSDIYNIHYGDIHATYTGPILDLAKERRVPMLITSDALPDKLEFLQEGDLVMADVSEDYEGIGACIELKNLVNKKLTGGLHTFVMRDTSSQTAAGFRGYMFKEYRLAKELKRIATGVSVYSLSKTNLAKIELMLPPLDEQQSITSVLWGADEEIAALEKKLALWREQKKYLLNNLVTGTIRLPQFCVKA